MSIKLLKFDDYCIIKEALDDDFDSYKDKETGEEVIDKKNISKEAQIRVLAKRLYKITIQSGRAQSKMNDKTAELQQMGADENAVATFQQLMQDQMLALQTTQMDIENQMMMIAGQSPGLSDLSQRLSGEAKILANKKNKEWFDKKVKDFETNIEKQAKEQQEKQQKANAVKRAGGKKDK